MQVFSLRFEFIFKSDKTTDDTMMTIHFNANLRSIVDKVGMLHWIMDPEVSGFIIAYDLSGNQVLICNFDVGMQWHSLRIVTNIYVV
jgi:hypothetical protein